MKNFSDYIVYVDESGDHGISNINLNYPIFVLAFCIFKKEDYISRIVPDLQAFKFKYWGHDTIILHEHDIRKSQSKGFEILNNPQIRGTFLADLNELVDKAYFNVIASVIKKNKLTKYASPENPYQLSMLFCLERLISWLCSQGELGKELHIVCESRGKVEDKELELEFRRICDNAPSLAVNSTTDFSRMKFTLHFINKKANCSGLQIADLVARPVGLHAFRKTQQNQAFRIIQKKFITHQNGSYYGKGLKIFPQ